MPQTPRSELPSPPAFLGLRRTRERLGLSQLDLELLLAGRGTPIAHATLSRMDRGLRVRESVVVAVRDALQQRLVDAYRPGRVIGNPGYPRVHLCLIAAGWEPHFYWEEGLWQAWTEGMRWQASEGLYLQVERERQGLTRTEVARRTEAFGGWWVIDHKTVRRVEEGRPCKHDSRDAIRRALGSRDEVMVIDGPAFDFEEILAGDLGPTSADDGAAA